MVFALALTPGALRSVPNQLFAGASVALDFTNSRYRLGVSGAETGDPTLLSGFTCTRASTGYAEKADGTLVSFAANTPRITNKGLLIEESRTNNIRNSTAIGGTTGTLGSGGVMPTNWGRGDATGGISFDVTVGQSMGGAAGIYVRFYGTPTASGDLRVQLDNTAGRAAASAGQTWAGSAHVAVVAGALTNTVIKHVITARDGVGSSLSGGTTSFTPSASFARYSGTFLMPASTATADYELRVGVTINQAIDLTLFIGLPQLELGAFGTSPIPTTSAAATRAADLVALTGRVNPTVGTWAVKVSPAALPATGRIIAYTATDGSYTTGPGLEINSNSASGASFGGNSSSASSNPGGLVVGTPYSVATTWNVTGTIQRISTNGAAVVGNTTLDYTGVGSTRFQFGSLSGTGQQLINGYIQCVAEYPYLAADAELLIRSAGTF